MQVNIKTQQSKLKNVKQVSNASEEKKCCTTEFVSEMSTKRAFECK